MMQMLNERAHKNRKETGVMPKIIENPEENILSAARRLVAEQGYAAVVSGTSDMETIEHIAKELQFRQTDEVIKSSDFENNCTFIDVGQG